MRLAACLHACRGSTCLANRNCLPRPHPPADPSWPAFKPLTCLRLGNFGNAEGFYSALLGAAPCSAGPGGAAVAADALRRGAATFTLDCTRGDGGPSSGEATSSSTGALNAALARTAGLLEAALDRTTTCQLAVASDGGGGALLAHGWEAPLLGGPRLDALRVRLCNMCAPCCLFCFWSCPCSSAAEEAGCKLCSCPL